MNSHPSIVETSLHRNGDAADAPSLATIDLYAAARRALRGRIALCLALAAGCALVGGLVGFASTKPLYKSEGLIRIAYALPAILEETDQNKPVAMFDSFLRSQQMRMSSRNLVEQALKNSAWQKTGRGESPAVVGEFASQLSVEHPAGTEHIRISYIDSNPSVACAAVSALVNTFKENYDQQDTQLQKQRIAVLNDRRRDLSETLADVGSRADQLALMDSLLSEYIKRQSSMENELKLLEVQGYLDNHRRVAELRSMLDRTSAMITQYSEMAKKLRDLDQEYAATNAKKHGDDLFGEPNPASAVSRNMAALSQGDSQARRDVISVEANLSEMQRLQADSDNIRKELAQTTQRMQMLKVESGLGGRLEIISDGDTPLAPFKDRRTLFMAAGALIGGVLPWAFFIALGAVCPRYRRSEDIAEEFSGRMPLLGTLPSLTELSPDITLSAGAAQSVHQTRLRLQILRERQDLKTILMTSSCAGEGKTSLTTVLGLSFAASGSRTLLIDLDFVGQRLTRVFRLEKRTGAFEALSPGSALLHVCEVAPSLSVMPAGAVDPQEACSISASGLRTLIEATRAAYDVVLIDGGPALGSVETSLAAPIVDGIVLAISRGQDPARIQRTMRHLDALGGRAVGVVFNRAEASDFASSSYRPSAQSASMERDRARAGGSSHHLEAKFKTDLLVESVLSFLPAVRNAPPPELPVVVPAPAPFHPDYGSVFKPPPRVQMRIANLAAASPLRLLNFAERYPQLQSTDVITPLRPGYPRIKFAIEWPIAALLCLITAPIVLLSMALVRLTSRGPAIYRQTRLGRDGIDYSMLKIRTMQHNCEHKTGAIWSGPLDQRVTKVGRILRDTHLDELPQLWNIVRGEMSLIGPRPERPELVEQIERSLPRYRDRLAIRPGLTGFAQIQHAADLSLDHVRRKLVYDLYYIHEMSIWLDLRIMIGTAFYFCGMTFRAIGKMATRSNDHVVAQVLENDKRAKIEERQEREVELHAVG